MVPGKLSPTTSTRYSPTGCALTSHSRQSLKKFVKANNTLNVSDAQFDSLFNRALKAGVDKGVFTQPKGPSGGTKLAKKQPEAKKPAATTTTKKEPAAAPPAKKPAAKKAAAPKKEPAAKKPAAKKTAAPKKTAAAKKAPATKKVILPRALPTITTDLTSPDREGRCHQQDQDWPCYQAQGCTQEGCAEEGRPQEGGGQGIGQLLKSQHATAT